MKIVLSHPTGNANVRAAVSGLAEANLLYEFYTSIACFPGSLLEYIGTFGPFSEINRRHFHSALKPMTRMWPLREIGRIAASKVNFTKLIAHEKGIFSIDAVFRSLDRRVASNLNKTYKRGVKGVYAYEDGAEYSFQKAKKLGIQCFYDLPTGHWRAAQRLLQIEYKRYPLWSSTMTGFKDSSEKLLRKDKELELADRIFVASNFTARTLQDYPGQLAPIEVIPYGFPEVGKSRDYSTFTNRPLKLLFVGKLTQQKGIADLFKAVERLGNYIELTVVGQKPSSDCPTLNVALSKHKWIPTLSHYLILQLMRENDILLFPSLFDGFGLVITEAMSQGTPVIATERSAGPELIMHGKNGWIIKASCAKAIESMIGELLNNPERITGAGEAAMETARLRPWKVYKTELSNAIENHFKRL